MTLSTLQATWVLGKYIGGDCQDGKMCGCCVAKSFQVALPTCDTTVGVVSYPESQVASAAVPHNIVMSSRVLSDSESGL